MSSSVRVGQSLHLSNSSRISIRTSNSIIESLLGKMASLIGSVEDLVVENGEVQGKTQTDRVSGGEFGLGNVGGVLRDDQQLLIANRETAYDNKPRRGVFTL